VDTNQEGDRDRCSQIKAQQCQNKTLGKQKKIAGLKAVGI
jgi:hypothetical protein